jgi:hypothetical protein
MPRKTQAVESGALKPWPKSAGALKPWPKSAGALKPWPKSGETVAHHNLSLIEVADPADLSALMLDSRVRIYILARLSDTVAVALPQHHKALLEALRKAGHTPKLGGS